VTFQTLTPTQLVPNAAGLDLTGALATPTNLNLQFANTGREFLAVAAASTSETVTLDIGVTILGQTVTNFTAVALTNAHTYLFGPFSAQVDIPGGSTMQITLSTITSISVALIQFTGVS
jgi:hypothetical protein